MFRKVNKMDREIGEMGPDELKIAAITHCSIGK